MARQTKRNSTRKSATPSGLMFNAVPTDGQILAACTSPTGPTVVYPGRIVLTQKMKTTLDRTAKTFWYPQDTGAKLPNANWVFNPLADADRYDRALTFLAQELKERDIPVFNCPDAILQTRRDRIWAHLEGIDTLIVPRTSRFRASHPTHFQKIFEAGGFSYPVLIRPTGSHSGQALVKIVSQADWHKIFTIPWGGHLMYMTQWVDFRSAEGEWRKLRLSITPHGIRLRHILYGEGWLIHSVKRDIEMVEKELDVLLRADEWQEIQRLGKALRDRVGLSSFGVDLGWKSNQAFVLFEANVSMSILSYHNMPEHRRDDYVASLLRIEKDIWRTMEDVSGMTLL